MTWTVDRPRLVAYLEAALPRYLADLTLLAGIDSGTFDKSGVDQVAAILVARYAAMGATIEQFPDAEFGNAFSARLQGRGPGKVLLVGHTDTVYPLGTTAARPLIVDGDRAMAPGSADMKAGDLAIVYALEALLDQGFGNFASIMVMHNSDEEVGSPRSKGTIAALAREADAALILEAGRENGDIVSARKGIVDFRLHVRGRAAHAGTNHDRGRSAALELAHLIVALEALNGTIPEVTLNVGRVQAGERINVVPDYAFAQFEARAFEIEHLEEMIRRVEETVQRRTVDGTSAELVTVMEHYPMHRSAGNARLAGLAQQLAHELGFSVRDVTTGGASDGNVASEAGCAVLDGLGPVGGAAHSPGEYIVISSIVPRTALLAGLVASLGAAVPLN